MFLLEAVPLDFVDLVYKYGALPLLLVAVTVLWRKQATLETKLDKLHDDRATDLKNSADESRSLQQSTLTTLNELTNEIRK